MSSWGDTSAGLCAPGGRSLAVRVGSRRRPAKPGARARSRQGGEPMKTETPLRHSGERPSSNGDAVSKRRAVRANAAASE
jgi:hypothetical protein